MFSRDRIDLDMWKKKMQSLMMFHTTLHLHCFLLCQTVGRGNKTLSERLGPWVYRPGDRGYQGWIMSDWWALHSFSASEGPRVWRL